MNQLQGITLKMTALSDSKSERSFFFSTTEAGSLNNSLFQIAKHDAVVQVKTEKLSDHISETVHWLKVDTEGAEGEIVSDLCATGKIDMVQALFVEYHDQCRVPLATIETLVSAHSFTKSGMPGDQRQMVFRSRKLKA